MQNKDLSKTEQKIIDVATELFSEKGFEGTSTRDICNAANVNISSISYYFGGKNELYKAILEKITRSIIDHIMKTMGTEEPPQNFDMFSKEEKITMLFKFMDSIIDYFYTGKIPKSWIMILFKEQITNGFAINSFGFKTFKKLVASILDRDENDKEIIFRCLSIMGQIHSARVLSQFSLGSLNQTEFTKDDIQMIKNIAISQTKSIIEGIEASK